MKKIVSYIYMGIFLFLIIGGIISFTWDNPIKSIGGMALFVFTIFIYKKFSYFVKETLLQWKEIWILIGIIAVVTCSVYVPWHLPSSVIEKYWTSFRYLPIFTYNWFWQMPDIYRGQAVVDYFRVFLNILISIGVCIGGYILTTLATKILTKKR